MAGFVSRNESSDRLLGPGGSPWIVTEHLEGDTEVTRRIEHPSELRPVGDDPVR